MPPCRVTPLGLRRRTGDAHRHKRPHGDRRLLVADDDDGSRLDEIALEVGERDRLLQRRRRGAARHVADFAFAAADHSASLRYALAVDRETNQLASDAAMPAMQHPDDHLLADITP